MRVIRSTVQAADISDVQEADYDAAIDAGTVRRQSYSTDEIGQQVFAIRLVDYTDPDGQHRWAVAYSDPSELDWMDTSDEDEATKEYERLVRESGEHTLVDDETGDPVPAYDYTDVDGVTARSR